MFYYLYYFERKRQKKYILYKLELSQLEPEGLFKFNDSCKITHITKRKDGK